MKSQKMVSQFNQLLLWPVQLVPNESAENPRDYWKVMRDSADNCAWREVPDSFKNSELSETEYQQFISYLPFAQRFLYGEGDATKGGDAGHGSPVHIFYRNDLRNVRILLKDDVEPITLKVAQCTMFFFYEVDIAILCIEVNGENLALETVMDLQFHFGRTYPSHWQASAHGYIGETLKKVEWLDKHDTVLSSSNYEDKKVFLDYAKRTRTVKDASHWAFLMQPMVQNYADSPSTFRYRKVGYRRTPMMSYIGVEDVNMLSRADIIRLGLFTAHSDSDSLPYSSKFLADFEDEYCYDRHWEPESGDINKTTRYICCEQGLVTIGSTKNPRFTDPNMGTLMDFKSRFYMLFLISHFQKATIMMLTDKLVHAVCDLDINDNESYKVFSKTTKNLKESILHFTHRFWFNEVSNQAVSRDVFNMIRKHNHSDEKYEEVRRRIIDLQQYIENEEVRVQSDTVTRLTIVSIFGLILTMTIGLLDINLFHFNHHESIEKKLGYFIVLFIFVAIPTFYTVLKSKNLSYVIDGVANQKNSINNTKHRAPDNHGALDDELKDVTT